MESEHENESNEHLRKDANFNEETSDSAENSKSSHSTASSSSESSSDYFQIDTKIPQKSSTFPVVSPKAQGDRQSPKKREKNESTLQTQSPVQSPPIQVMEKTGGYDPDRIPGFVFGRSSSAVDWSVASTESLFSLQLGNNSFSREHFLMYESGELHKPHETVKPGRPPLSPLGKLQEEKAMDLDKKPEQTLADDETMGDSLKLNAFDQLEEMETEVEVNGHSSMINRASDASGTSTQSFAFPILVDTTQSESLKGPSSRQQGQGPKQDVYEESPQINAQTKSSSSHWSCCCCCYNFCSLPQWSCPSYQHCRSWKWCKKWFCCSCC